MGKLQKLDNRIQFILKDGIRANHRTMFVMVGNKGQDQVPIMHQILNSLWNKGKLNVLWCYKKDLSFSTHRKKNLKLLNKKRKAGNTSDGTIFEQFICSTDIRWCYYHETHKILGQTFDMCILQDFEALTPNTLARTIETVCGGGLIVFLLKSMDSLKQLCSLVMDVHSRYRTEAHQDVVCRFNERFLLSLAHNPRCLALDDRWRILPLSKKVLTDLQIEKSNNLQDPNKQELNKLKVSLTEDGSPFAPLVKLCITFDQARCLVQLCAALASTTGTAASHTTSSSKSFLSNSAANALLDRIGLVSSERRNHSSSGIVVVTSGRGRGKSAALGLGLAAAIEAGLPNLYVTAPSPENLSTLMQFVFRGLTAFGYEEHQDYSVIRSTDPEHNRAVVQVDVFRQAHRQSLIYLPPMQMAGHLGNSAGSSAGSRPADLVCVDEAAAIPLALVRLFVFSPRLVYMASTVSGYEGTGRSLSLKLVKQLREECQLADASVRLQTVDRPLQVQAGSAKEDSVRLGRAFRQVDKTRSLYEVELAEAIRYTNGDPVETWLTDLLCLDCGQSLALSNPNAYYPPVDQCQLYFVNRDTLFAYHKSTELFLHRIMALYVASHYKNSPNDLQLLSDAPAHMIFVLLAPYDPNSGRLPELLCVLQVCLEGQITKDTVLRSLSRGLRPSGDLIPWTLSQQFCDASFGGLSGARVVRIATHPDYQGLGYGSRALKLLYEYYNGNCTSNQVSSSVDKFGADTLEEIISPRDDHKSTKRGRDEDEEMSSGKRRKPAVSAPPSSDQEDDLEDEELIEDYDEVSEAEPSEDKASKLLLHETIERRGPSSLPPLLSRLNERPPERLHYLGVSFGATPSLLRFWKRAGYAPLYFRQTMNELTGEFSCIMAKEIETAANDVEKPTWLCDYHNDFIQRFIRLLPGCFRYMDAAYALEVLHYKSTGGRTPPPVHARGLSAEHTRQLFSPVDVERLHRYTRSLVDFHVVSDLFSHLAELYFTRKLPEVRLNKTQQVILLGLGLQHKTVDRLASELSRLLDKRPEGDRGGRVRRQQDEETSVVLAHSEEAADSSATGQQAALATVLAGSSRGLTGSGSGGGTAAAANPLTSAGRDAEVSAAVWPKRIRGLTFVVVRELVRALDARLTSELPAGNSGGDGAGGDAFSTSTGRQQAIRPAKGMDLVGLLDRCREDGMSQAFALRLAWLGIALPSFRNHNPTTQWVVALLFSPLSGHSRACSVTQVRPSGHGDGCYCLVCLPQSLIPAHTTPLPHLTTKPGENVALGLDETADLEEEEEEEGGGEEDDAGAEPDGSSEEADSGADADVAGGETVSPEELERRTAVVRQLMTEEMLIGSRPLETYQVHGSEAEWAKAVGGHGSDLSSLRVKLSSADSQKPSKGKMTAHRGDGKKHKISKAGKKPMKKKFKK